MTQGSLFPEFEDRPKRQRKVTRRWLKYKGKTATCHQCILIVHRGQQPEFPRAIARHMFTTPDRVWLICDRHFIEWQEQIIDLPGVPRV